MSKKYQRRAADLIRTHLAELLARKANDPRLQMITITDVVVNADSSRAHVHYSVRAGAEERKLVHDGLSSAAGWLRREIGQRVRLRNTPQLVFHYDPSLERGEHIVSILDGLGLHDRDSQDDADEG